MLIYCGIDEAGYGPMLGPLVVGCTTFVLPDHDPADGAPDLWSLLKKAVSKDLKSAKGRIAVNDSKKLKLSNSNLNKPKAKHPLIHLERGVLSFLDCLTFNEDDDALPIECLDDRAFYRQVVQGKQNSLNAADATLRWYLGDPINLPVGNDPQLLKIGINPLRQALTTQNIQIDSLAVRLLTEPHFNAAVDQLKSKAAANLLLIGKHLAKIFRNHGHAHPRIIIDRQSGRVRYRDSLHTMFPEADIRIIVEEPDFSRYELHQGTAADQRAMTITFTKEAEEKHLPVALASMLAKYTRELMMLRLNRFFQGYLPELKPTAGYVQDARRFLIDVDPVIKQIGLDRAQLVRKW